MYIADVPLPLGLPFAFFPLTKDRTSGFIIPSFGDNRDRGFFFQNGGYYFAISDYLDLTIIGDYYTNGSYAIRAESSYALRYKFKEERIVHTYCVCTYCHVLSPTWLLLPKSVGCFFSTM